MSSSTVFSSPKFTRTADLLKDRTPAFWCNALILGLTFCVMVLFNILTPLISDDYTYLMTYPTTEPIHSFGDIISSQIANRELWSGRNIALGLNQFFLWIGKGWFNLVNAAAFCLAVWLAAKLVTGRRTPSPLLLLCTLGLLFHCNPCFGAVNLWVCGSCVYLFPLLFALALLLPYRLQTEENLRLGIPATVGVFVLGLLAGWGNENTSGAAMLAVLLFVIWQAVMQKRVPLWSAAGLMGVIAGFALMMSAPGQWVRMDSVTESQGDSRSLLTILLTRIMNCTHSLKVYGLWLVVLFGALFVACIAAKVSVQRIFFAAFWFVLALAANYALVLCPVYYVRSFYPVLAFLTVAICTCLCALAEEAEFSVLRLCRGLLAGALCAFLCFDLLEGGYDIASYYRMRQVRDADIAAQVAEGVTDIETYAVFPYTRFCGAWGQPDLRTDPNNWVNTNMALHFGAGSISATEQHYYPFPGYDDFSMTVEQEMSLELE